jgi:hypothetical protein
MPSKLSEGGEQQRKDNPPKLIPNLPSSTVSGALANSKAQVAAAK